MRRYASVVRLRPEHREEYLRLHENVWPAVEDMIVRIRPSLRAAVAEIEADLRALGLRQATTPQPAAARAGSSA